MRTDPWRPALLATLVLALAGPVHAQWVWRDQNGRITASDLPPPNGVADKDIVKRPPVAQRRVPAAASAPASGASAAAALPARAPQDPELQARRKAAEQEQVDKQKAETDRGSAQRAENCARARAQVTALESGQRLARFNDKGEREVLDDAARAAEMRRAREIIASDCR